MAALVGLGHGGANGGVATRSEVPGPSFEGEPVRRHPIVRFRLNVHLWTPPTYKIRHGWVSGG